MKALFTRDGYADVVSDAVAAGYEFVSYPNAHTARTDRTCLLRHDVDADPGAAAELARIEHAAGVRATYFFMLRSPVYNLFGRANAALVGEILQLGHWLGLHYDVGLEPQSGRTHEQAMATEATFLAELFDTSVDAVSFHQPGSIASVREIRTGSLVSAYDFPGFRYVTDANKAEDFAVVVDELRAGLPARIQVLIHPLWWVADDPGATTAELWDRALVSNLERSQAQLVATERAYGEQRRLSITRGDGSP